MPTVSGTVTDKSGNTASWSTSWTTGSGATQRWGMQCIDNWDTKLTMVGPNGITGRRWYGNITSAGNDKASSIAATIADGMTVCLSDKVPSFTLAASGSYDAWAQARANHLQSYGVPIYYAIWHEPYDDMTAAEFTAMQRRLIPFFAAKSNIKVGFVLHGWLLDNPSLSAARFNAYIDQSLMDDGSYDFAGIDSYQTGSDASPGSVWPHHRLAPLKTALAAKGKSAMHILIGEWNAWRADAMTASGNAIGDDPQVEWAFFWNNTGGVGKELTAGDPRLSAFQDAKARPVIVQ